MEVILKLLHYLSIFAAGGIGVGGAVIQSIYTKANKIPEPHLGKSFRVLGIIGLHMQICHQQKADGFQQDLITLSEAEVGMKRKIFRYHFS